MRDASPERSRDPVAADLDPQAFVSLLTRMGEGDVSAATRFVTTFKVTVAWQVHHQLGWLSMQDQEDALWDTLAWLIRDHGRGVAGYDPTVGTPPIAWVRMKARGHLSNVARTLARRLRVERPEEAAGPVERPGGPLGDLPPDQLDHLEVKERRARALAALDARLSPTLRETFNRVFVDQMEYPEAAAALGCSVEALRRRVADLRQHMRVVLDALGEDQAPEPGDGPVRLPSSPMRPGEGGPAPPTGAA